MEKLLRELVLSFWDLDLDSLDTWRDLVRMLSIDTKALVRCASADLTKGWSGDSEHRKKRKRKMACKDSIRTCNFPLASF